MTRVFLLTAVVFFTARLTLKADYYYGQNEYYRPDYYSMPPPTYRSAPPPPPAYAPADENGGYEFYAPGIAGPYFRADGGLALFSDTHLTHFGVPANDSASFKTGFTVDAAGGFQFNQNVSADFEFGFNGAPVDHINFFTFDRADYYNLPFLVNIIGSLPLQNGRIVPYLGGGVGGAVAVFDTQNLTTPSNPTISGTEATTVFAAQFFVGVRFQLNSRMWLGGGYRYFTTSDPTWTYPGDFKFGFKAVNVNAIMVTFLWKF